MDRIAKVLEPGANVLLHGRNKINHVTVMDHSSLARPRTQSRIANQIDELSVIIEDLKRSLNYNANIASRKLMQATKLMNDIITVGYVDDLRAKLGSIPNFGEILLASCSSYMIYETPERREQLAGQVWSCIQQVSQLSISHYNTLLLVFIENNTQFDPSKILEDLKSKGLSPNRVTLQRLLHRYCLMGDMKQALKILEDMKENSMEINETVFASLFLGYGNIQDAQSLSELLQLMRTSGVEPGAKAYVAYICAHINCDGSDQTIKDILDEATKEDASLSPHDYVEIFTTLVRKRPDSPLVEDLSHIIEISTRNLLDFGGISRIMYTLLQEGYYKTASSIFWNIKHNKRTISNGQVGSSYISNIVSLKQVPVDFIMKECKTLIDRGLNMSPYDSVFSIAANNGRADVIERLLDEMNSKDKLRCHYYWPLLAQATDEKGLLSVLEHRIKPDEDQEEIFDTFVEMVWPRMDSTSIENNFQSLSDLKYDRRMLFFSYLEYLRTNDDILSKLESVIAISEKKVFEQKPMNRLVENLTAQRLIRKLMDVDIKMATELYITLALKFGVAQGSLQLMLVLLKDKNKDDLQRVIDATNRVLGEGQALTELVIACIRTGHVKQADKIIRSSPNKIYTDRLDKCIDYFASLKWTDSLKNLLLSAKGLNNFDRDKAYYQLLRLYDDHNQAKETLELCIQMQEDGYQLGNDAATLAASILERNNLQVPFTKVNSQE